MTLSGEMRRLSFYEECAGPLGGLTDQDDVLIAHIGNTHLSLPLDMKESLRALIGQRISILHTDIPDNFYLFRVLDQEKEGNSSELESGLAVEENEKRPGVSLGADVTR